ncbi:MAG: catalase [Candidatus Eremiobacteraeota bacterium]|nr:catalase [Candidatus Eremiobacteraeota bacterium]
MASVNGSNGSGAATRSTQDRGYVPERIVRDKSGGAFGYFEVTHDVTDYTSAGFLSRVGKRTGVLARFASVANEYACAETTDRNPRGFAVKFYTAEGTYDVVGNNTPVFVIRDAMRFPEFIHSQRRDARTGLRDANRMWDFFSLFPESLHQVTHLMGDRGLPLGWQFMNGYGKHTFQWINGAGKAVWVKYHFKTELGVKNMTRQEAASIACEDTAFHRRSLFDLIDRGDVASWALNVQIMTVEDAAACSFDPFDVTKVWPHKEFPLIPVGRLVLNRNPENFHTDIEQAAFEPSNFVRGVWYSPDKMLHARLFAYADGHRYQIGTNPAAEQKKYRGPVRTLPETATGELERAARNDDYVQAGDLYRLMPRDAQVRLVDTIVGMLDPVRRDIQVRAVSNFTKCDATFGEQLARGLALNEDRGPASVVMAAQNW